MKALSEKDIQRQCNDYLDILESRGDILYWRDNYSIRNKPGFPDLMILQHKRPYVLFVELKSRNGRLSETQTRFGSFVGNMKTNSIQYHVIRNVDDLIKLMEVHV